MSKREDEYYRQNYYGGHPPACTCVKCTERRLAGLVRSRSNEKLWLYVLAAVCVASSGLLVWLLLADAIGITAGLFAAAVNLAVFIWALSARKHPWSTFRSGVLGLIIILLTLIVSLAG